jgi:hypothetical protein
MGKRKAGTYFVKNTEDIFMIEKKVEDSTACNAFMKNATAVILEYVLEVGIDKAVEDCVKDSEIVRCFPHLESYAKEHGFI